MKIEVRIPESSIQDGFVVLDCGQYGTDYLDLTITEEGEAYISVGTQYTSSDGIPMDVWHGRTLVQRFLEAGSDPVAISLEVLKKVAKDKATVALVKKVISGHSTRWDGSNMRGSLTETAREAWYDLGTRLEKMVEDNTRGDVWHAVDWIYGDRNVVEAAEGIVTPASSDEEIEKKIAPRLVKEAEDDGVLIVGGVEEMAEAVRTMRDDLRTLC